MDILNSYCNIPNHPILYEYKLIFGDNTLKTFTDTQIRAIKQAVGYRGRKIQFKEYRVDMSLNSYWDSGSRDYFYWVSFPSGRLHTQIPQNGTPFDKLNLKTTPMDDTQNLVLVEKVIIRGRDVGINIYSK